MRITIRRPGLADYEAGKRALAMHDPARALPLLRRALEAAHPGSRRIYADRVYWLSVALLKLGKDALAIKALASAQGLYPRGRVHDLYCRVSNEYGMPRASCAEHDDYKAFLAIQLRRYLAGVPGGRFASQAEIDAVLGLIAQSWLRLIKGHDLSASACAEKVEAYKAWRIDFPALREGFAGGRVVAGDFRTCAAASLDPSARCPCGSGLPAQRCCARVQAPYER